MIQTIYAERGNFLTQAEAEAWAETPARDQLCRVAARRPDHEIMWPTLRRTIKHFEFNTEVPKHVSGWRQGTWGAYVEVRGMERLLSSIEDPAQRMAKAVELMGKDGPVRIERIPRTDRYGRTIARVYVNGRDLGEMLIGAGLGRPYRGERRQTWC